MSRQTILKRSALQLFTVALIALTLQACDSTSESSGASFDLSNRGAEQVEPGSTGVSQPGAQDFGRVRSIIEAGELPSADLFDSMGFFSEHKFELPPADCGQDLCVHAQLGVGGNLMNGNNCIYSLSRHTGKVKKNGH